MTSLNPLSIIQRDKLDIVIYTTSLNVGVNILSRFACQFMICNNKVASSFAGITQTYYRIRDCPVIYMIMSYYSEKHITKQTKEEAVIQNYKYISKFDEKIKSFAK